MKILKEKLLFVFLILLYLPVFSLTGKINRPHALVITGEQSGEDLARWFLHKKNMLATHDITALCSVNLANELHIKRLEGFDALKKVTLLNGIGALCKEMYCQKSLYSKLYNLITTENPNLLVLVDFPWVNLRLARALKKKNPSQRIIFIAPPELWFWGCWGIDKLLRYYCDEIIVLYPHEQEWYKQHNLTTTWLGYPYLKTFENFIKNPRTPSPQIAFFPGSRDFEVEKSMPLVCSTIQKILAIIPALHFIVVRAASIPHSILEKYLEQAKISAYVKIIEHDDYESVAQSFYALTKPGTVSLNLALLGVPHALFFKTSWFNNKILTWVIRPPHLSLPNLLSQQTIVPEFTQDAATPDILAAHVSALYASFIAASPAYVQQQAEIRKFSSKFLDDREKNPSK